MTTNLTRRGLLGAALPLAALPLAGTAAAPATPDRLIPVGRRLAAECVAARAALATAEAEAPEPGADRRRDLVIDRLAGAMTEAEDRLTDFILTATGRAMPPADFAYEELSATDLDNWPAAGIRVGDTIWVVFQAPGGDGPYPTLARLPLANVLTL